MNPRRIENGKAVALVLGIDLNKVTADSLTLEPYGTDWLVRWEGFAVLSAEAAAILFGDES